MYMNTSLYQTCIPACTRPVYEPVPIQVSISGHHPALYLYDPNPPVHGVMSAGSHYHRYTTNNNSTLDQHST